MQTIFGFKLASFIRALDCRRREFGQKLFSILNSGITLRQGDENRKKEGQSLGERKLEARPAKETATKTEIEDREWRLE